MSDADIHHGMIDRLDLYAGVVGAVERVLVKQLRHDRMRTLANEVEREQLDQDYDDFCEWAAGHGWRPGAHVAAAYLLELANECGADDDELRRIADAILYHHNREAYAPIRAALAFCLEKLESGSTLRPTARASAPPTCSPTPFLEWIANA
jgi:hypothetical protein